MDVKINDLLLWNESECSQYSWNRDQLCIEFQIINFSEVFISYVDNKKRIIRISFINLHSNFQKQSLSIGISVVENHDYIIQLVNSFEE